MVLIMRAYQAHLAATHAMIMFASPGPIMPTIARISTSLGKDIITSATRIRTLSARPRSTPASAPYRAPMRLVSSIAPSAE